MGKKLNPPAPSKLRAIPAVEKVLQSLTAVNLPRPAIVAIVRRELAALRASNDIPEFEIVLANIHAKLEQFAQTRIQSVINGTGIVVHTNLGRSPLGPSVVETLQEIASTYSNLEFDLQTGERGGRAAYVEHNLALLCGAEAATVVNNCAAALVLILRYFTAGARKEVIISRGELVQIGGGFRIPEILEASGAVLKEVGATNKTSLRDYSKAIGKNTSMILKVHRSNFFMGGFVESPTTEEIAQLARKKRIPFVEDLGSGAIVATEKLASIDHEPTPAEVLKRGVDLVCFSGDKLLGGPQAGLIAGRAKLIKALKKEPFFRALRCDKLVLSALQTTVDIYLDGKADVGIPTLEMLKRSCEELQTRAEAILAKLKDANIPARITAGKAQVGGGTLPQSVIPSVVIALEPGRGSVDLLAQRMRAASPVVIGYIAGARFNIDLRTVHPTQDAQLLRAIRTNANVAP